MYQQLSVTRPKARKVHQCIWCPEKIALGTKHVHEVSTYEGEFQDHRWHEECWTAATRFFATAGETEFEPQGCRRGTSEERP